MNIVILGAGTVGSSIADQLCSSHHSVTVVDADPERVRTINEKYDVRAITGSASQSSVLFQAGMLGADLCLAVTGVDEVNIVAASMARKMGARRSVARVYGPVFRDLSTFDYQQHFGIDRLLSLEHLTAMELARCIRNPGSVVVEQFARGGLEVLELIIGQPGKATQVPIRQIEFPPNVRLGTIQRANRMWIASAEDQLEVGDRITVFSGPEHIAAIRTLFKIEKTMPKRVVIAGGGETGLHLARMLERESFKVMLIEKDKERCQVLAGMLESTSVVNDDATMREVLEEERVESADFFVASTGDDESNMMLSVGAKDVGAKKVLAVIGRPDYSRIIERIGIDIAVSERAAMSKQINAFLNDGNLLSRAKLPGGLISVLEVDVAEGAAGTLAPLAEVGLPDRCLVAAIIRQDAVYVPGAEDQVVAGDIAILIVEEDVIAAAVSFFS
ncbi:Trk system potassium transporter TrkA [Mariniblastus fucicola]|uniref:Trk system potassium uptake protein TrkA n=1 Tax=Mariniblastus fucicola TaxID=980251 RepID=A0A5B9PK48_9BACT|nr:Trk system potassium transporter TrkA [Mariniblastus fucicola]QEG22863.1 Trk system potassium uptake protein TrkA [Mariniblastus fucicola]